MEEIEIACFTHALQLASTELYLDAIAEFDGLVKEFPDSDLADDALYNAGLCYFQTNQFEDAIKKYQEVIDKYPDSTISELEGGNEFGRTAAKCRYSMVNACLALGEVNKARSHAAALAGFEDTYVLVDGNKKTYANLAEHAMNTYMETVGI